jgi:16S rRNA (cytosine967-C5)-methyltransferase
MAPSDHIPFRLHPNLVAAVEEALATILVHGLPADKVMARLLKSNPRWGARDRAFIAETTYEILRYLRHYVKGVGPGTDFLRIIGWHFLARGEKLPDWPEWDSIPALPVHPDPVPLAIRESVTDWLDRKGREAYGERWPTLLAALNQPAPVVLRVNPLRSSLADTRMALAEAGIDTLERGEWALELEERANVFRTAPFLEGWFEVQDLASQQIAPLLDIRPGQRIVDACAGAGGKTLHLAALTGNKGQIIALDTEKFKLLELRKRANRAGATNVETRLIDHGKVVRRLYGSADRLLLDVPCTGSGVLRRNPDAKWRINEAYLAHCQALQAEILDRYSRICKPGGRMVYATCSILREENQEQIAGFLTRNPGFTLEGEGQFLPDDFGYDGFYYAILTAPTGPSADAGSDDAPSDN